MSFFMALVSDPKENIAGRYFCNEMPKDTLRRLIAEDWKFLNNYVPEHLNISFQPRQRLIPEHNINDTITALVG